MKSLIVIGVTLALAHPVAVAGQIVAGNSSGVAAGHEHFRAKDVEAATRFWKALGAKDGLLGKRPGLYLPGVVLLFNQATANAPLAGGSEGTSVETIGVRVPNLRDTLKRMAEAGYTPLGDVAGGRAYLMEPNGVKVEVVEDSKLKTPIASEALRMKVPDVAAAAEWYSKWFGAKVVRKKGVTYAEIPGMNIRFEAATQPVVSTRGHAIDHIGFEVRNLEAFMKKLQESGANVTTPYTNKVPVDVNPPITSLALVVDPWGTVIELNEGFAGFTQLE